MKEYLPQKFQVADHNVWLIAMKDAKDFPVSLFKFLICDEVYHFL